MFRPFVTIGGLLITVGVVLILLGIATKYMPPLERLPPILVYVYRRGNFYFVTSPILILLGILFIIILILGRLPRWF